MAPVVMMSMCVVVSLVAVQLQATSSDGATATPSVVLPPMTVPRVRGRLEAGRKLQAVDAVGMGMDSVVRRTVVLTTMQTSNSPSLGYGSLRPNNAVCGSSCAGRPPGEPYLHQIRPCGEYYQCPSTPS
ncbi:hypothetical protein Zm00014a_044058 [Zea mays]|uniref:Uncharacterized protein n=1 Tax=Zea mays TaxID=4577 RepID=A0A317YGB2_MAIZE|nr:hypothetical protein Zm00014a_044058 [Zea mays]